MGLNLKDLSLKSAFCCIERHKLSEMRTKMNGTQYIVQTAKEPSIESEKSLNFREDVVIKNNG